MFNVSSKENVASALKALIGTKAETPYEKFLLLDQRDKILKQVRTRVSDVQTAAIFVGTCLDMCPEKERYEREVQKRLSSYELVSGAQEPTVDHRRAVKDYGRSAADQEEPLPHELRPAPVLDMTMNYLMGEIALNEPRDEVQLPGWYDFLWKRTRAIRKDMTQLMLEGHIPLALLEKCARFHIFCAHQLCEFDIGDFDQKMNTENLTKCLQSLKHMYEDMSKKGQRCPNEAEFRAYDVLLSLNDTDVLREILTYDVRIRQSPHVRFAFQLFSSMQNNNYVAFFRLIHRRATYLQACLAHRYFDAVRAKAFDTMVRAFTANSQLPVSELVQMLGFENHDEAVQFASLHNLIIHPRDNNLLTIDRLAASGDEQAPKLRRSTVLVESKRDGNLGEILNGGHIAPVHLPTPVVSFDHNHYYCKDKVVADILQGTYMREPVKDHVSIQEVAEPEPPSVVEQLKHLQQALATRIFRTVTFSSVSQLTKLEVASWKSLNRVVSNVVPGFVRSIAQNVLEDERKRKNMTSVMRQFEQVALNGILNIIGQDVRRLAVDAVREAHQIKLNQRIDSISIKTQAKLINVVVQEETRQLCSTVYQEEVQYRQSSLERIRENLTKILTRRYLERWKAYAYSRAYRRRLLEEFPCCPMVDDFESPPLKKQRTSVVYGSPYNWIDMLDSKKQQEQAETSGTSKTVVPPKGPWILDHPRQHASISAIAAEFANAKKATLNDFPCQPKPSDSSVSKSPSIEPRKDPNESVYNWMDSIMNPGPTAETPAPVDVLSDLKHKRRQQESPTSGRGNLFKEIPLTESRAREMETLEMAKRLRTLVKAENEVGNSELSNWEKILNTSMDSIVDEC